MFKKYSLRTGLFIIVITGCILKTFSQIQPAKDVVGRLIPQAVDRFTFQQIPAANGYDVFEVEASGGAVTIRGSTPVAMCRGVYDYLKTDCKCLVTWDGDQLNLPNPLPNTALRRVVCPYKYRHYFNVCTFGYTTVFWDWNRWQREIDWMALHGINMPLALNGLEKVLQDLFKSYGFTDSDLSSFFTGPAFLPWQRMGNVYGFGGPIPMSFIDSQAVLQKKIVAREMELGMIPVTPGFCGFVPNSFPQKFPNSKVIHPSSWLGFPQTTIVEPRDTMFTKLSKDFLERYKQEYGATSGHYLIDLFNEMTPQVNAATKNQELRQIGYGVMKGLKAADANAIWVMQGWLFYNAASFWDNNAINAFLDSVPDSRMIILDLACDEYEVWRTRTAVSNRQIIWNWLHNYGQKTPLHGKLNDAATKPISAYQSLGQTHMVGMGLTPEGIENNAVIFELMCDMMWRTTSPAVSSWVAAYATQRYGSASTQAVPIWNNINTVMYNWRDTWDGSMKYQLVGQKQASPDYASMRNLIIQMLAAAPDLKANPLFIRDLVDVSKRYFAEKSTNFIVKVLNSTGAAKTQAMAKFSLFMNELDALLATIPQHRLDRWIAMARATVPQADKDYMEKNARIQVTTWVNSSVPDYAKKEWSGLINQFYLEEWNLYFNGQSTNAWRDAWIQRTDLAPPKTVDPVNQVYILLGLTDSGAVDIVQPVPIKSGENLCSIKAGTRQISISLLENVSHRVDLITINGRSIRSFCGSGRRSYVIPKKALATGLYILAVHCKGAVFSCKMMIHQE